MATLAPKLPYTHPFAGGFPYRGSQRLPSDPDALTYLAAVAAADGAPVETAVATAVDDFFKGCKADPSGTPGRSNWDAIKASCILCGARTLAGALVPLAGTAPTNVADGFVAGDYTRGGATPGLKGDGTSYLDSGRAEDADGDDDHHIAAYMAQGTVASGEYLIGAMTTASTYTITGFAAYSRTSIVTANLETGTGLYGVSRSESSGFDYIKASGSVLTATRARVSADISNNHFVFAYADATGSPLGLSDNRLAFYSIGEALDLALLDARVTALVTAIGAAV
jgi:hypothetical protein